MVSYEALNDYDTYFERTSMYVKPESQNMIAIYCSPDQSAVHVPPHTCCQLVDYRVGSNRSNRMRRSDRRASKLLF